MTRASRRILGIVLTLVVLGGGAFGFFAWQKKHAPPVATYKTETVQKRKIVGRITATGTLQATVTVLVGTQVSGRVAKLYADYNSKVTKGQLVAKIDPQLFEASLLQAQANYQQNKAAETKAIATEKNNEVQYNRTVALNKQSLAATADVEAAQTAVVTSQADVSVAKANLQQAQAQLSQAQVNLEYTNIVSPIDGVVISRSVDVGQTVAASLSAPTIFTIAEDLRKMQVNTNVSEGDVGRLEAGQTTSFTVDAFPGRNFKGVISQIRNSATTVSNVVTYDAVIDVDNADLKLRPGMTANVTVNYAERDDAVAIPNSALRFHPPTELSSVFGDGNDGGGRGTKGHRYVDGGAGGAGGRASRGDGGARRMRGDGGAGWAGRDGGSNGASGPSAKADGGDAGMPSDDSGSDDGVTLESRTLYVLRNGAPAAVDVVLGLSDGSYTEVVSGDLHETDEVITDATVNGKATTAGTGGSSGAGGNKGGGAPRMF